jgi:hypothetical protein
MHHARMQMPVMPLFFSLLCRIDQVVSTKRFWGGQCRITQERCLQISGVELLPRSGFVQHGKVDMLKAARSTVAGNVEVQLPSPMD